MRDILTVAGCTLRRYSKKPLALVIFLFAPLLLFIFITGSSMESYISDVEGVPGGTCLTNSFISPAGGVKTADRECLVFMLMCLYYFAVVSCVSVTDDLKTGLSSRFKASPVGPAKNILGKAIGNVTLLFGYSAVLVLIGRFLFGIQFGSRPAVTAAALLLFCVIVNSLGILLSGLVRNIYVTCVFVFCLNFPMMFVVMYKIFAPIKMTPLFSFLNTVSLHNYAYNAIMNAGWSGLLPLLAIAVVIVPLSLLVGREVLK